MGLVRFLLDQGLVYSYIKSRKLFGYITKNMAFKYYAPES